LRDRDSVTAGEPFARGAPGQPLVSVIIPTLNEAGTLGTLIDTLGRLAAPAEVIVSDGGSTDGTVELARLHGALVLVGPRGRGEQLRRGASAARAPLLCFLHADAKLPAASLEAIARLAKLRASGAYAFRLRIDAEGHAYRAIEASANLRSRLLHLPFGDQGLIVARAAYDRAGGYPPHPIMEDVALARGLRRATPIRLLDESILVSARRWRRDGPYRRSVRNAWLLLRYYTGTNPQSLASGYRPEGELR
jgi:rSAM/selenodomain-associated transferase 2